MGLPPDWSFRDKVTKCFLDFVKKNWISYDVHKPCKILRKVIKYFLWTKLYFFNQMQKNIILMYWNVSFCTALCKVSIEPSMYFLMKSWKEISFKLLSFNDMQKSWKKELGLEIKQKGKHFAGIISKPIFLWVQLLSRGLTPMNKSSTAEKKLTLVVLKT